MTLTTLDDRMELTRQLAEKDAALAERDAAIAQLVAVLNSIAADAQYGLMRDDLFRQIFDKASAALAKHEPRNPNHEETTNER